MLAFLVATEGSGVESPFRGEGEVREEHFLSTGIPGGGFYPEGELYFGGGEKTVQRVSKCVAWKKQNVEA